MLTLKNIKKSYKIGKDNKIDILKGIDLEIKNNEFIAIIGPSGSGKSTLMNIIGLLDREYDGEMFLDGKNVKNINDNKLAELRGKQIGFIFQNYSLIARISAFDQIMIPLNYQKIPKKIAYNRAYEYLEKVGLLDKQKSKPNELSGGQNQRVSIARALATKPSIILADEPTGALDSKTGAEILDLFEQIHSEGKTVILITHDKNVAKRAKRVLEIMDGEIIKDYLN